jgi:hypothetical protein
MAFESQSLKKKSSAGVFGDVLYGALMLPKELEIEKGSNFELGFQVPDVGRVINVSVRSLFSFIFLYMTFAWLPGKLWENKKEKKRKSREGSGF